MTKIKTSELTGAALDWAVAKCEGVTEHSMGHWKISILEACTAFQYSPSTDWAQGGPIIEREKIDILWQSESQCFVGSMARSNKVGWRHLQYGPTPLIAAMRCLVASKLGDEVEIPDVLTGDNK